MSAGAKPTPRRPLLVAAAVVFREGRVLITQRPPGSHLEGLWEFPGGKVEPGEDPAHTVLRECEEECAIAVGVEGIYEVSFQRQVEQDVLLLFYRCRLVRGEVAHQGVQDHSWVTPEEIGQFAFPPADQPVLRKLLQLPKPPPLDT